MAVRSSGGVNLEVRAGEILGIAGVAGNGQDELVEAITGLRHPSAGSVTSTWPRRHRHWARDSCTSGASSFVPADRHRFGLVLSFPLDGQPGPDRATTRRPTREGILRDDAAIEPRGRAEAIEAVRHPNAVRAVSRPATLSGGNQQKVVVAREFDRELRLLVLDQPTRGLDVGSIEFIHRQAIAKRDAGTAVLLVSAELDEVLELSDRIARHVPRQVGGGRGRANRRPRTRSAS